MANVGDAREGTGAARFNTRHPAQSSRQKGGNKWITSTGYDDKVNIGKKSFMNTGNILISTGKWAPVFSPFLGCLTDAGESGAGAGTIVKVDDAFGRISRSRPRVRGCRAEAFLVQYSTQFSVQLLS